MARQRDLLVNFERMRREVDELVGDVWGEAGRWLRPQSGFSPRVDVYYCGEPPRAIVKVDLAGVSLDSVSLEVSGRRLTIGGERPLQETEGRVYQQIEIQSGPFRRVVDLSADVVAQAARATYEDGVLRVELPLRTPEADTTQVPIESGD
jgi:HSP20 family protein